MENENWIKISTAAKIHDVTRQAMYSRIPIDGLTVHILDGRKFLDKDEVGKMRFRGDGSRKRKWKKN